MQHVDGKEGLFEFGDSWVMVENGTDAYHDPGKKINIELYPFCTTCCKYEDGWYVMEENLKIDPPTERLNKGIEGHPSSRGTSFHPGGKL